MLTEENRSRYARDGAICLRSIISEDWLSRLAEGVAQNMSEPGPHARYYTPQGADGHFFGDYCNWQRIHAYRDFAFHSPAAAIVAYFMDTKKVNFFHEHVLVKEPRTAEPTPWHHDQPYWVVDGRQVCSLWIPLDPVARQTAVEFVAGSHRWGAWYQPQSFTDRTAHPGNEGDAMPDITANRADYTILGWDMQPGDAILFHALTLHGAPGNRSSAHRRRAVAMRWTGDDARFVRRDGYMSPPFEEVSLSIGDAMDSETFPIVYPRDAAPDQRSTPRQD